MGGEILEVECPVCDHKVSVDAVQCPNCKAVFSLSGVDELEKVVRELNAPAVVDKPAEVRIDPPRAEGPRTEDHKTPESAEPKQKDGLLGMFFKKKK